MQVFLSCPVLAVPGALRDPAFVPGLSPVCPQFVPSLSLVLLLPAHNAQRLGLPFFAVFCSYWKQRTLSDLVIDSQVMFSPGSQTKLAEIEVPIAVLRRQDVLISSRPHFKS